MKTKYHYRAYSDSQLFLSFRIATILIFAAGILFFPINSVAVELTEKKQPEIKAEIKSEIPKLPPVKLTSEAIQEKIDKIKQMPELSTDSKERITAFYNEALKSLERQQTAIKKTLEYSAVEKENISETKANTTDLSIARPILIERKARSMALTEIENKIAELQAQLGLEQTNLELSRKVHGNTTSNPSKVRQTIASHEAELAKLQTQLDNPTKSESSPRLIMARKTSIRAKCAALKAEVEVAEKTAEVSRDNIAATTNKIAVMSQKVDRLEKLIKTWGKIRETRQSDIGYTELRQNNSILNQLNSNSFSNVNIDFLKKLAKRNIEIAKNIISLGQKENEANKVLEILKARQTRLENDFTATSRRIKMMGLTKKSGKLLQTKRALLLSSRADPDISKKRTENILNANLNADDMIQEIQNYLPFKDNIYKKLEKYEKKISEKVNDILATNTFMLLESYRKLLGDSGKIYGRFIKALNDQQAAQKKINTIAEEYKSYINQRLLWTSSAGVFSISTLTDSSKAVHWLLDISHWKTFVKDVHTSFIRNPTIWILIFLAFAVSILFQFFLPKQINRINKFALQPKKDSAGRTIAAVVLTVIKAVSIPLIICLAAFYVSKMNTVHIFSRAVCIGIIKSFRMTIIFIIILHFSKINGIGILNFQWSKKLCNILNKYIIIFLITAVPIVFLVVMVQNGPLNFNYRSTLGRSLFILLTVFMLSFFVFVLRKIQKTNIDAETVKWLKKNHLWVNTIFVTILLALIIFSAAGYYFTAYEFSLNITQTFYFLIIFLLVRDLLHRILFLSQIHIAYKKAEVEKKAVLERKKLEKEQEGADLIDDLKIDIIDTVIGNEELNKQAFKLINFVLLIGIFTGIIVIWSDTFPSIQLLNNVVLWNSIKSTTVDGISVMKAISLLNFLQALFFFLCTAIIVKNLPAILEIIFFRGKKTHPGTRHAFSLISKYIVIAIGFFAGLKFIGIGWVQFQYMAAAMTVGLSFGLKDIFANFVSGIIILIERPIRLGDTVTVAGSSGVVTKIRIRSTTITDFDRHELIVPNMSFLSEKIVNWSLSDQITRLVIDIGIAYNSNAKEAEKILLQIAEDSLLVMKEPKSSVIFVGFGADSLDFKLRFFVNLSDTMTVQHQIRHEIYDRFNKAGIDIPFAQRDIHINPDEGPLKIQVVGEETLFQKK